jgi:predicted membrane protein
MKIFKRNIWKITSFILAIIIIFIGYEYFKEYQRNLTKRKELEIIKNFVERSKKENMDIQKQILASQDPLNQEKEKKYKFGEALEGETEIFISKEVLNSIILPFSEK